MTLAVLVWAAFSFPAHAIMDKGDVVFVSAFCTKDSVFKVAKEDEISPERGDAMFEMLEGDGSCWNLDFRFPAVLDAHVHTYTEGETGYIVEIWRLEGEGDKYALIVDARQFEGDAKPSGYSI